MFMGSDFHLGHRSIGKYRDGVSSPEENYEFIADNWPLKKKKQHVFLLGDMVFEKEAFAFLQSLPGTKHLIMGNHDWERFRVDPVDIHNTFETVKAFRAYKGNWLSHCPMDISEMRRKKFNIHGHIHDESTNPKIAKDPRYYNVNVDVMYPKYKEIIMNTSVIREECEKGMAETPWLYHQYLKFRDKM